IRRGVPRGCNPGGDDELTTQGQLHWFTSESACARKTRANPNTGNLGSFCPFGGAGLGGGNDDDGRVWWLAGRVRLRAFEGPVGHFPFDDARVGASAARWQ